MVHLVLSGFERSVNDRRSRFQPGARRNAPLATGLDKYEQRARLTRKWCVSRQAAERSGGDGPCEHAGMPRLGAKERAQLPDSAFAYIDSHGRRRLPIHDASHVRNALSRFNQVVFESEGARDRARGRLLRAAKKQGIMPIGFISAQLQPQLKLPKGQVTFLLTDI